MLFAYLLARALPGGVLLKAADQGYCEAPGGYTADQIAVILS